jgi:hypothetical protein
VLLHRAEEAEGTVDVDIVVVEGNLAGLADSLEGGEVNDTVDVGMRGEDLIEFGLVGDVALRVLGALAGDQLNAVEDLVGGVVEVVDDDDLVVSLDESKGGERANVASATVVV